jgi:hypothetical protein
LVEDGVCIRAVRIVRRENRSDLGCAQNEGRTVPQRAEDNEPTFDWAIGWLARENQIVITPEKRSLRIRLKQEQAKATSAS